VSEHEQPPAEDTALVPHTGAGTLAGRGTIAAAAHAADAAAAQGVFARYRADLSAQTRRAQDADLDRWARYLAAVGAGDSACAWAEEPGCWAGVSWGLVEGFLRWQERESYSLATIARSLSTVRGYCKQAARAGVLPVEALALIETVKSPAPRSKAARNRDATRAQTRTGAKKVEPVRLTPAQARQLKREHADTPEGRRDALLMCLMLDHGLRVSEAIDLQVVNLQLAQGLMSFYRRKVDKTQTHRLSPDTLRAARRYYDAGDAPAAGQLLRTVERRGARTLGGALSVQGARELVGRLGRAIGVLGLSPHDCRHFWATRAAAAGTNPLALQEAGGWNSLVMPRRYIEAAAIANDQVRLGDDEPADANRSAPFHG
jgi:integrase